MTHSVLPHNLDRIIRSDLPLHLRTIMALSNELESLQEAQALTISPDQGQDFSPNQLFNKNRATPAGRKTIDAVKMTYTTIAEFAEKFLKSTSTVSRTDETLCVARAQGLSSLLVQIGHPMARVPREIWSGLE